jgi:hypothetical protein
MEMLINPIDEILHELKQDSAAAVLSPENITKLNQK